MSCLQSKRKRFWEQELFKLARLLARGLSSILPLSEGGSVLSIHRRCLIKACWVSTQTPRSRKKKKKGGVHLAGSRGSASRLPPYFLPVPEATRADQALSWPNAWLVASAGLAQRRHHSKSRRWASRNRSCLVSAGREGHSCLHWVTLLVGWQQLLRNCCSPRKQEKKAPVQEGQRDPDSRSERQDSAKKGTERKRFVFSNAGTVPWTW